MARKNIKKTYLIDLEEGNADVVTVVPDMYVLVELGAPADRPKKTLFKKSIFSKSKLVLDKFFSLVLDLIPSSRKKSFWNCGPINEYRIAFKTGKQYGRILRNICYCLKKCLKNCWKHCLKNCLKKMFKNSYFLEISKKWEFGVQILFGKMLDIRPMW